MGPNDDDGTEELEINDETGDGEGADDEQEDRGDEVNPEETPESLKKLAEEEGEDEEPPAKGSASIPKPRFDEVNEKRIRAEERARIAEEELQRLRGGKSEKKEEAKTAFDFDAKEEAYMDALMEGDKAAAKAIRKEIDAARREEMEAAAEQRMQAQLSESRQRQSLADAASAVIADYPFLDSKSAKADKEAIADVVDLRDTYIRKGMSAADALLKAAEKIGKLYAPAKKAAGDEDDDEDKGGKPKSKIDELRAARLRKNAATANAQPARLDGGVGNRGTGGKVNVADMDEDTFKSLTEKQKAQLRGDVA